MALNELDPFRLQIFDDGAGEYIFDQPANIINVAGTERSLGLSFGAIGPFILPSPLPICSPGLMTVTISNVNAPNNIGSVGNDNNTVNAYVGLVFAIPKKCKGICYGGSAGEGVGVYARRGVLS